MGIVLVVGDIMIDVVVTMSGELNRGSDTPSAIDTAFGGTGSNVAAWLGDTGAAARIVGNVGDDLWGRESITHLTDLGVEVHIAVRDDLPTGMVVALAHPDGERSFFADARANSALHSDQFDAHTWSDVSHMYVSGYLLFNPSTRDTVLAAMRAAREAGISVVLDPASAAPLAGFSDADIRNFLVHADVLLPNVDEAAVLERLGTVEQWQVPTVVIKRGSHGATLISGGSAEEFTAEPVQVIDTVGAGDAFAAGFLAALARGRSLRDAVAAAVALGSRAVTIRGAQPGSRPVVK